MDSNVWLTLIVAFGAIIFMVVCLIVLNNIVTDDEKDKK